MSSNNWLADAEIVACVREHFQLDVVSIARLPSYVDQNYLLTTAENGARFVLKAARLGESREALELQNLLIDHLSSSDATASAVPRVLRNSADENIVRCAQHANMIRVMTFVTRLSTTSTLLTLHRHKQVPGKVWADVKFKSEQLFVNAGKAIATLAKTCETATVDLERLVAAASPDWDLR